MIKLISYIRTDNLFQFFQIHNKTCLRINLTFYCYKQFIIMAMPVGICTFPKNFHVFLIAPFFPEQLMCCIKSFSAGYIDHFVKN